jgi:amidophosphoribosyltransferase
MCGVAGILQKFPSNEIAQHTYTVLFHLSQRGQDSAGIAVSREDGTIKKHTGLGTLDRAFFRMRDELKTPNWAGVASIGHLRYATSGVNFSDPYSVEQAKPAIQPMEGKFRGRPFLMSFNGNLVPSCIRQLEKQLQYQDRLDISARSPHVDSQLMMDTIESSPKQLFTDALLTAARKWQGAFSTIFLYDNTLFAIRDSHGFRPLVYGMLGDTGILVSSEDNIFDETKIPGARFLSSVEPGQCVIFKHDMDNHTPKVTVTIKNFAEPQPHKCAFEDIYFRRQDSFAFTGERVALYRRELGHILAREQPPPHNADLVVGVPDSGVHTGHGYAEEAGVPYLQEALFRIHGAERSFIEPVNDLRQQGIELKLSVIPEYIKDKKIIVVDDSIVRGNVLPRVVYLLKHHGAKEVHLRIGSPPIRYPCYFGIDTWRIKEELIALKCNNIETIRQTINERIHAKYDTPYILDSLGYLSINGLQSIYPAPREMCYACWTGEYPMTL